jgi:hypothetical protein
MVLVSDKKTMTVEVLGSALNQLLDLNEGCLHLHPIQHTEWLSLHIDAHISNLIP